METKILIFLIFLSSGLIFLLLNNLIKMRSLRKSYQRVITINEFLLTLLSDKGPSLAMLTRMEIDTLERLGPELRIYYRRKFFRLIAKSAIEEIEPYIKSINELPDSLQKEFIKKTLRKEILSGKGANLVDIIFRVIKLSNTENSKNGLILKSFLFDDVHYCVDNRRYLNNILVQCHLSLEKISVDEKTKTLMINDFNELIKKINQ